MKCCTTTHVHQVAVVCEATSCLWSNSSTGKAVRQTTASLAVLHHVTAFPKCSAIPSQITCHDQHCVSTHCCASRVCTSMYTCHLQLRMKSCIFVPCTCKLPVMISIVCQLTAVQAEAESALLCMHASWAASIDRSSHYDA